MQSVLIDLGFKNDIDISKFQDFSSSDIEFLICSNKDVDTSNLRKKLKNFKFYIFEPTLYISDINEINKLKRYFLKNTNSISIVSYDEFIDKKIQEDIIRSSERELNIKPMLAFFSPIPNEKTGVSLYSEELLEELVNYYQITIIVEKLSSIREDLKKVYDIQEVGYFLKNADRFDRIIYQMGGSSYHLYMYEIIKKFEGVVVFHDFYMSQLYYSGDLRYTHLFYDELYYSHGFKVFDFFKESGLGQTILNYPANLSLIDNSLGIITHSNEPKRIFDSLYGSSDDFFSFIPLLRKPAKCIEKNESKKRLNLPQHKFIISTFGYIGSTKLTLEIVKSFSKLDTIVKNNSLLLIVGQSTSDHYMDMIKNSVAENSIQENVKFVGWSDNESYKDYLNATDLAIQLRSDSRGESSAAVLDCFNYSLPVIINNHGSMKDLPRDSAYFIEEKFSIDELAEAINKIYTDRALREKLASNSKEYLDKVHNPQICAKMYYEAVEQIYAKKPILKEMIKDFKDSNSDLIMLSKTISSVKKPLFRQKTIFIDITAVYTHDLKTGIQRVVRAQLLMLLQVTKDYRVEPVYYDEKHSSYFYARDFMKKIYGLKELNFKNEIVDVQESDIFYGLDYIPSNSVNAHKNGIYKEFKAKGARVFFVVYDNIPISHPHFFPSEIHKDHVLWLREITSFVDGLICISESVAKEVRKYIKENNLNMPPVIKSMKLGCDIKSSLPALGFDAKSKEILRKISSRPTFLMVGTLEPRKGHDGAIKAFDMLWQKGYDINLVIVGKMGWMVDSLKNMVLNHHEKDNKLIYLNFVSDEMLDEIYKNSSCLIAASRAEGFGLPLVEAAIHKIPIIARDLEVFKEVSNGSATFFASDDQLPAVIAKWLDDFKESKHIKSDKIELVSWQESSIQAYKILTGDF